MDTQVWSQGPDFTAPRAEFSMANIHGRVYALAGRKDSTGVPTNDYNLDGVVLREDLRAWDVVSSLVFDPFMSSYVMIPYNL